jgi:chorismate synthase
LASNIGKNVRIQVFGQSHSAAIGVTIDGIPAGKRIDTDELQAFLDRRAPGRLPWVTPRKEADRVEFLSGLVDGVTCGAPIGAVIANTNTRSSDYARLDRVPRPGHADYVAREKYHGAQDFAGGGHFSGRLTAPLCVAGGIALQLLREEGVRIGAHLARAACIDDACYPLQGITADMLDAAKGKDMPVLDDAAGQAMAQAILAAREACDSVGGVVECAAIGVPVGLGDPMFDGVENVIAKYCFGIPAVKGIEFGVGFEAADLAGSVNNDAYRFENGKVRFESNNAGGALGGISTGEPVVFRLAFKPTPSISGVQHSVNLDTGQNEDLSVRGRHDPCVAVRAVPVVEAVCALALYDMMLESRMR